MWENDEWEDDVAEGEREGSGCVESFDRRESAPLERGGCVYTVNVRREPLKSSLSVSADRTGFTEEIKSSGRESG